MFWRYACVIPFIKDARFDALAVSETGNNAEVRRGREGRKGKVGVFVG